MSQIQSGAGQLSEASPSKVLVFYLQHRGELTGQLRSMLMRTLRANELERLAELATPHRRDEFLLSRGLLRQLLARQLSCTPEEPCLQDNMFGRPELRDGVHAGQTHPGPPEITFNISHGGGCFAWGFSRHAELGVDLEHLVASQLAEHAANAYFNSQEIAQLRAAAPRDRRRRLLQLWTLKEALLKGRGTGLSVPLSAFSMELPGSPSEPIRARSCAPTMAQAELDAWEFAQWEIGPLILAAAAHNRDSRPPLQFELHELAWPDELI